MADAISISNWLQKYKDLLTLILASWGAGLSTYNVVRVRLLEAQNRKRLEFSVVPIFIPGEHQPHIDVRLSNQGKKPIKINSCCYTIKGDVKRHLVIFDFPLALPKILNPDQEMNVAKQRAHDKDEEIERFWIEYDEGEQWPLSRKALQEFNSQQHQIYIQIKQYWEERAKRYQEKKASEKAQKKQSTSSSS